VAGNVANDNAARADHCPRADIHTTDNRSTGAKGSPGPYVGPRDDPIVAPLKGAIGINRPWSKVIGEADLRPHKHTVFDCHPVIQRDVVLNLDSITDDDTSIYIGTFSDYAFLTNTGVLSHLREVPDLRTLTDLRQV
jgi:hypothetical protein